MIPLKTRVTNKTTSSHFQITHVWSFSFCLGNILLSKLMPINQVGDKNSRQMANSGSVNDHFLSLLRSEIYSVLYGLVALIL